MPNIEEARDPPPFMFKSIVERELREEDGLYYLSSKHGLRSRRGAALAQSTLRSGKLKSSSPVEGEFGYRLQLLNSGFIPTHGMSRNSRK